MKKKLDVQSIKIAAVVAALIIAAVVCSIVSSTSSHNAEVQKTEKVEAASSNFIKSFLNVYYLNNWDTYPTDYDALSKYADESQKDYVESLKDSRNNLIDFNYKASGDQQTYKFTYKAADGNTKTITGNYQKDFN